jgi:hypothetical protein
VYEQISAVRPKAQTSRTPSADYLIGLRWEGLPRTQLGFPGYPFVPVGGVFEPILRRAPLIGREQANDLITASAAPVGTRFGPIFNDLADLEFMI